MQYTVYAENLLVTKDVIKVADFAVAGEVCSHTLILTMSPLASMLSPRPCTNFHTLYPWYFWFLFCHLACRMQ
jgi:hypothetical protein